MIAIIPARGGSKRIPGKNIKAFRGHPVIMYSIYTAKESNLFNRVIVSTDDLKIWEWADHFGAEVDMRPDEYATDEATSIEAMLDIVSRIDCGQYACMIYPVAPLMTADELREGFKQLVNYRFDSVFSVVKGREYIERAMVFDGDRIRHLTPEKQFTNSQEFYEVYYPASSFFWFDVAAFKRNGTFYTSNAGAVVVPHSCDIDTVEDWERMEASYETI